MATIGDTLWGHFEINRHKTRLDNIATTNNTFHLLRDPLIRKLEHVYNAVCKYQLIDRYDKRHMLAQIEVYQEQLMTDSMPDEEYGHLAIMQEAQLLEEIIHIYK